jgi:hypothetical protein
MRAARDFSSKMSRDLQVPWLQHIFFLERAKELRIIILREEKKSKEDQSTMPRGQA